MMSHKRPSKPHILEDLVHRAYYESSVCHLVELDSTAESNRGQGSWGRVPETSEEVRLVLFSAYRIDYYSY